MICANLSRGDHVRILALAISLSALIDHKLLPPVGLLEVQMTKTLIIKFYETNECKKNGLQSCSVWIGRK
jgi:hypothetical protein